LFEVSLIQQTLYSLFEDSDFKHPRKNI